MLLVLTFDAVFSHLYLTNGCIVKKVNTFIFEMLKETNNFVWPYHNLKGLFFLGVGRVILSYYVNGNSC